MSISKVRSHKSNFKVEGGKMLLNVAKVIGMTSSEGFLI